MDFSNVCNTAFSSQAGYLATSTNSLSKTFGGGVTDYSLASLLIFLVIAYFVVNILILLWIKSDRFARTGKHLRFDLALFTILFGPVIGFIYYESRPKGKIDLCFHCGRPKLRESKICYYCAHEDVDRTRHLKDLHIAHHV